MRPESPSVELRLVVYDLMWYWILQSSHRPSFTDLLYIYFLLL